MEYLVTFYIVNNTESKNLLNTFPYQASVFKGNEKDVMKIVITVLKSCPYLRCCSIMTRQEGGDKMFEIKNMLMNPFFSEEKDYGIKISISEKEDSVELDHSVIQKISELAGVQV